MSPPPAEAPMPLEPKRPTALTVVGIIGIIFGIIGVLCVCAGLAFVLMGGQQQEQLMHTTMREMILQMSMAVAGIVVSTFLLIACIGAMSLRPWSATMMVVINIINLLFETFKIVLGIVYTIPRQLQQMTTIPDDASQQQIQMMQFVQAHIGAYKIGFYALALVMFVVQAIYSLSVLMAMKRADVKAALANPNDLPQTPMM
jgi:hypothetical protein